MSSVLATVWRKEVERFVALCVCLSDCLSILSSAVSSRLPDKIKWPVFGREIVMKYHVNLEEYSCTI